MKRFFNLPLTIVVLLGFLFVTACDSTTDMDSVSGDPDKTLSEKKPVLVESSVFDVDVYGLIETIDCLGDTGEWFGFATATETHKILKSGMEIFHWTLDYDTADPYHFVGENSGTWTLKNGEDTALWVIHPNGRQNDYTEANELYVNDETGKNLRLKFQWHYVIDADGNYKLARDVYDVKCN